MLRARTNSSLLQSNATVLAVTETWPNKTLADTIYIPDYVSVSKCRENGKEAVLDSLSNDTIALLDLPKIDNHRPTRAFFNTLNSYHYMPSIVRPTRITSDSATLIDNIFTNEITYSLESAIIINDFQITCPLF